MAPVRARRGLANPWTDQRFLQKDRATFNNKSSKVSYVRFKSKHNLTRGRSEFSYQCYQDQEIPRQKCSYQKDLSGSPT